MSDLISKQAAIHALERIGSIDTEADRKYARSVFEALPSAQPEIIRCRDCKHYQFADDRVFGMPVKMCKWLGFEDFDDDDFCSRAERRENR